MFSRYFLALMVISQVVVPGVVQAQESLRGELDSEVSELYPTKKATTVKKVVQVVEDEATAPAPAKEVIVIEKEKNSTRAYDCNP